MKYTIERLPESRVAIDVELDPEQVEEALDRAARRIANRVRIPGFRPGKAPRYIVEARYGRAALYEEIGDELIQQAYQEILDRDQDEIDPIGQASLEHFHFDPFSFRLVVPTRPTVVLGDYRGLRFSEEPEPVTEEDVEEALSRLQAEQTIWQAPDPLRPAQLGDRLVVDLVGRVDGREIERQAGVEVELGGKDVLPQFSEGLIGAEAGQEVEFTVTLPDDLEDETLAGRPAEYAVVVHAIKEAEVPALDDGFARSFGQEDTLAEMRERVHQEMGERARQQGRERVLNEMIRALVDGAEIDMPQVLVDREIEALFQAQKQQLEAQQMSMELYLELVGKSEETYREELRDVARRQLARSFALGEFVQAEALTVQEEDVEEEVERRIEEQVGAEAPPERAEALRQELLDRKGELQGEILSERLKDRLLAIARGDLEVAPAEEGGTVEEEVGDVAAEEVPVEAPGETAGGQGPDAEEEAPGAGDEPTSVE